MGAQTAVYDAIALTDRFRTMSEEECFLLHSLSPFHPGFPFEWSTPTSATQVPIIHPLSTQHAPCSIIKLIL
jgi:hypothetical protein